jgi:hypothetical protein
MPTTTNYGWTTPADTDLVKDGASAIRTLGTAIDTTVFNNAGAAIAKTIVDAKGDIIAATAADTVSRLAVGTNGQYLAANSSTATGLEWQTVSAGGMTLINTGGTTLTGATVAINSIPATYKNLQLVIRNFKPATDNKGISIRFNSDSTANRHAINFSNAGQALTFDSTEAATGYANDDTVANGLIVIDFPDYANTTTWKWASSILMTTNETTTTQFNYRRGFFAYNQTGAISSLLLLPESGNFTSGTAFLYGVS